MSGTFPLDIPVKIHSMDSQHTTFVSRAHSQRRNARERPGHLWKLTIETPPLKRKDWQRAFAFIVSQRGRYETFTVIPKVTRTPLGIATGSPLVTGAGQAGRSITTDGWTASVSGILKAGDFIKFQNHSKVYMVTSDVNSDSGGAATIPIEPALITIIADNEALTVRDVPFTVCRADDNFKLDLDEMGYSKITLNVEESF
jgi:hypothetical protein